MSEAHASWVMESGTNDWVQKVIANEIDMWDIKIERLLLSAMVSQRCWYLKIK